MPGPAGRIIRRSPRGVDAPEILAEGARDGLVDSAGRVGVLWHANIDGFSCEIARFVILEAGCLGVNRAGVALCLEVPLFGRRIGCYFTIRAKATDREICALLTMKLTVYVPLGVTKGAGGGGGGVELAPPQPPNGQNISARTTS